MKGGSDGLVGVMAIGNPARMETRRHALLMAIVQDYVATAEPVGSKSIVREHSLGVRSATIRSMMGELEDDGYLYQPHTSAGRVPTEIAFRYYVNNVIPTLHVGMQERSQ